MHILNLANDLHEDCHADIVHEVVSYVIEHREHNQADAADDGEKE